MCSLLIITVRSSKVSHLRKDAGPRASGMTRLTWLTWPRSYLDKPSILDVNEVPANLLHRQLPRSWIATATTKECADSALQKHTEMRKWEEASEKMQKGQIHSMWHISWGSSFSNCKSSCISFGDDGIDVRADVPTCCSAQQAMVWPAWSSRPVYGPLCLYLPSSPIWFHLIFRILQNQSRHPSRTSFIHLIRLRAFVWFCGLHAAPVLKKFIGQKPVLKSGQELWQFSMPKKKQYTGWLWNMYQKRITSNQLLHKSMSESTEVRIAFPVAFRSSAQ